MRTKHILILAVVVCWAQMVLWNAPATAAPGGEAGPLTVPLFEMRSSIDNCRLKFTQTKQGRVAFLGGSITAMSGWRDLTCDMLRKRFPETTFDFINAGIGGTNSTLGAFRLEQDVFKNGQVDLLFVEYAVNDDGAESPSNRYSRAMEGIIRHARRLNPQIDLVIQYFADTGKVEELRKGVMPAVIVAHDKIAAHYAIPALNMAAEMTRRMDAGAFTWEQFSHDTCHPSPFGHQQYAECIGQFLDAAWAKEAAPEAPLANHVMPAPYDPKNYENGRFIDIGQAVVADGWERLSEWKAEKTCNYGGPVEVLAAEKPGASFTLTFEGALVGVSAIAGMDAGVLEYSVDGGAAQKLDLFDHYCEMFHRPVCHMFAEDLPPGKHALTVRVSGEKNSKSQGTAARILKFTAN